jgi:ferredoxin-NADP reductase
MRLVYANQTEEDILLKRELDEMAKDKRFEVHYICSRPQARPAPARAKSSHAACCEPARLGTCTCQAVQMRANSARAWLSGEVRGVRR